jgi:hypothetical protein
VAPEFHSSRYAPSELTHHHPLSQTWKPNWEKWLFQDFELSWSHHHHHNVHSTNVSFATTAIPKKSLDHISISNIWNLKHVCKSSSMRWWQVLYEENREERKQLLDHMIFGTKDALPLPQLSQVCKLFLHTKAISSCLAEWRNLLGQ